MKTNEIKQELRRSACEDVNSILGINIKAWSAAVDYQDFNLFYAEDEHRRMFYLLVAEAL